jgi:2-oxoglutarate dehydrogenase E2 component (dihydrolipoamide succinyltransferase)
MTVKITIPSPGESVSEVVLGAWHKQSGQWVEKDELLVEIETDKVTMEVPAPESGLLQVGAEQGQEMQVGDVLGTIDPDAQRPAAAAPPQQAETEADQPAPALHQAAAVNEIATATSASAAATAGDGQGQRTTPLARKVAADQGVDLARVRGTGPSGRVTKADVLAATITPAPAAMAVTAERGARREKMSRLRLRVAERLVAAQRTAAMLTTFNEADMSAVMALRKRYKEPFLERYGIGLGFMSFFVRASVEALQAYPRVNAFIVGDEIEYHDYVDISVAVGTDRGLVVPILRDAQRMAFADIEARIKDFAVRARDGKLTLEEMTGGTFTLSNGGIYGSMNSTPILNPPQSGILGMHRILNRPVEDPQNPGQVALRPMMYLALSYDHRIIDGAEAVGFLVKIRDCIEHPERMLIGL